MHEVEVPTIPGERRLPDDSPQHELGLAPRFSRAPRAVDRRADARIAALLGITIADPVLYIQSSVRLAGGRPVRWTENWFREDRYQYTAEMLWKKPTRGKR